MVTQNADRSMLENAALAVDKGRILAVGPASEIRAVHAPAEHIDLGDSLLMPGLINAHTHASMSILRGFADDLPLQEWLTGHIFPLEARLTPEIIEWAALLGCAEMIRTGTTAFADMYLAENAVIAAAARSGMRCLAGEGIFNFPSVGYPDLEAAFALVRDQAVVWKDHPRMRIAVAPHAVYTTTPELLARCAALAEELDAPIMIHAAENAAETRQSLELFGKRPIVLCAEAGLLTPRATLEHCVDLDDAELALLAQTGACIAHNPRSNMKLASGVARFGDLRKFNISVALGTDGAASNNQLNMFAELSACALLHKVHTLDPTTASAQEVLDAATLGGAHALGITPGRADPWAGLGSLTPGAPADCIALDLTSPNLQPIYSPASHLVYAASGHETRLSMVDGKILYRDGKFLTIDYPELLREIKKIRAWVKPWREPEINV